MKRRNLWLGVVGSVVTWCVASGLVSAQGGEIVKAESIEDLKELQGKIKLVVEKVRPATVGLTSTKSGASGSGVIVNQEGLILTAAHVVGGNSEMSVIFPDGKAYIARVLGANRTKDVAMLQLVKKKEWPFAELGSSDIMEVGEHMVTMGHAGGFDTRRPAPVRFGRLLSKNKRGYITSDSVLIGGDSGGPVFNLDGKIVGINSSIGESRMTNNHAGISSLVKDWDRLLKGDTWGSLSRNPLADPDRAMMGFIYEENRNKGVIVVDCLDGSPAVKAGLKNGDLVVAIGNEKVKNGKDLEVAMSHHEPDDVVEVTLMRDDQEIKYKVKLSRRGEFFKR